MIAQELEVSLHMAFVEARQQRHEFITVEHLLMALLEPAAECVAAAEAADLVACTGQLGVRFVSARDQAHWLAIDFDHAPAGVQQGRRSGCIGRARLARPQSLEGLDVQRFDGGSARFGFAPVEAGRHDRQHRLLRPPLFRACERRMSRGLFEPTSD